MNAALVGRPDLMADRTSLTVYPGMIGMSENVFINVKNRSHTITAEVGVPKKGANGVVAYRSAHIDEAVSELGVNSSHSVQGSCGLTVAIASEHGAPALSRFLTAVRRKS